MHTTIAWKFNVSQAVVCVRLILNGNKKKHFPGSVGSEESTGCYNDRIIKYHMIVWYSIVEFQLQYQCQLNLTHGPLKLTLWSLVHALNADIRTKLCLWIACQLESYLHPQLSTCSAHTYIICYHRGVLPVVIHILSVICRCTNIYIYLYIVSRIQFNQN